MWAIRVLSGPQAGQIFSLKIGKNIIGRTDGADIKIESNGVSKDHAEITVLQDKILVLDLNSRNGTFINGVKIQNGMLRLGDKAAFHDVLFDIVPAAPQRTPVQAGHRYPHQVAQQNPYSQATMAPPLPPSPEPEEPERFSRSLQDRILDYMENVAFPGIYRLPEVMDVRWVLGSFVLVFILAVTVLSVIPMTRITAESIEAEGRRRALTIARNLASVNQQALLQGSEAALNVEAARIEEGVKTAMIVSQVDGSIMAPAEAAGRTPNYPFIVSARRGNGESVTQVDGATLGASVPISYFDPELGSVSVKAHAIVIYNKGSLALDNGRTLSLFIQTLVLALILGYVLFICIFKLMERPLVILNEDLDLAMREKRESANVNFKSEALQELLGNINSLLSRAAHASDSHSHNQSMGNKETEAENIIQLISYPSLAVSRDFLIIGCNNSFEAMTSVPNAQLRNTPISSLPEISLHQKLTALIQRASLNPTQIAHEDYEYGGEHFLLSCQAVTTGAEINYFVVSIGASAQSEGAA